VRDEREEIRVEALSEPLSHYTDAVRVGRLLFASGCAPLDRVGRLVGGEDVLAQTRQVLSNMQQVLAAAGASFSDVAKVTVYLTDVDDRQTVDVARREFFGAVRPASTLVEVSRLAVEGMKVEIECVAILPGRERGNGA
jgi:2-iminobutanoate/2-iminopropanoate deaminase